VLGIDITPAKVIAIAIFLLVGFPVHEFSHALAAYRLGDGTAKMFGRLTLNPIVHFDPLGGALLVLSAVSSGIFIGWAKPTPVNPMNLRGRHGEAIVAVAGPLSNVVMASIAAIPLRLLAPNGFLIDSRVRLVAEVLAFFVEINIFLFLFNLIPVPPLDGSKVLYTLLDPRTLWRVRPTLEQYGFLILLLVVFLPIGPGGTSIGFSIIEPIASGLISLLVGF
jgi:Zn-dependent protease